MSDNGGKAQKGDIIVSCISKRPRKFEYFVSDGENGKIPIDYIPKICPMMFEYAFENLDGDDHIQFGWWNY